MGRSQGIDQGQSDQIDLANQSFRFFKNLTLGFLTNVLREILLFLFKDAFLFPFGRGWVKGQ